MHPGTPPERIVDDRVRTYASEHMRTDGAPRPASRVVAAPLYRVLILCSNSTVLLRLYVEV